MLSKIILTSIIAITAILGFSSIDQQAHAISVTISDQASCQTIPNAVWSTSQGDTCTITTDQTIVEDETWTVNSGIRLIVDFGVTIANFGTINNNGIINNIGGTINNDGTINNNRGFSASNFSTINNNGTINSNGGHIDLFGGTINNNDGATINLFGGNLNNNDGGFLNITRSSSSNTILNNDGTINIGDEGIIEMFGGTFNNNDGATINNDNIIFNDDRFDGTLNNLGIIINNNDATIDNGDGTNNDGATINNSGTIENFGTINNEAIINNHNNGFINNNSSATIENFGGTINNEGTITNEGTISIQLSSVNNFGTIDNHGTITMFGGSIHNFGTINNHGTIDNDEDSTIFNYCEGILSGEFSLFLVVQKPCDTIPPTIGPVSDITQDATGPDGTTVNYDLPEVTDDTDPTPTIECNPVSGSLLPVGTTTITCTAKDISGNTSTASFTVTVLELPNSVTISDQDSCESISDAVWSTFPDTCTITTSQTIEENETWTVNLGVTLTIDSGVIITNIGTINNRDDGLIDNSDGGTINNSDGATINNNGHILNSNGSINNFGSINNDDGSDINNNLGGIINNDGTINNFGTINNSFSTINNNGTINNNDTDGIVNNDGAIFNGNGSIIHNTPVGTINNRDDSFISTANGGVFLNEGTINNFGTINIDGTFNNFGTINNSCNGDVLGTRPIPNGNAVVQKPCDTIPPTIGPVSDITQDTTNLDGAMVDYDLPTVTDDTDPNPTISCDPESGSLFPIGTTVVTCTAEDESGNISETTFNVIIKVINVAPICSESSPSVEKLWPPNHKMVDISILGVTDSDGDDIAITIDSLFQDEAVSGKGSGNTSPDGTGIGTDTAQIRAERSGNENGRVYHIGFTADDGNGGMCSGEVTVGVPHNKKSTPIDDGAIYDSTVH